MCTSRNSTEPYKGYRKRIMETVNVLQRGYKRANQYEGQRLRGEFARINQRYAQAKWNGLYLGRNEMTIMMHDLLQAVYGSEQTISSTSLSADLLGLFSKSTVQYVMTLVCKIAEAAETCVPDNKMRLISLQSGWMMGGYLLIFKIVELEK